MKKVFFLLLASALMLSAADVTALAKKCAVCHGAQGEKSALNKSKIMNQMSKADFIAAVKGYKDGSYGGASKALMLAQVKTLDDEQITALADFYIK